MTDYSSLSLDQVKSMARRVETQPLGAMSELFEETEAYVAQTQAQIYQLIDSLLQSWQGEASGAAGSSLQRSTADLDRTRNASVVASSTSRSFAADLEDIKAKIAAIPKVNTSLFHAITSGGLLGLALGPVGLVGGAAAAYFSHQSQAEANRRKAVQLLTSADVKGQQANASFTHGSATFPLASGSEGGMPPYPLTLPSSGGPGGGGGAGWGGAGSGAAGNGRVSAAPTTSTAAGPVITSGGGTGTGPVTQIPLPSAGGDASTVPAGFQPAPPANTTVAQGAASGSAAGTGFGAGGPGMPVDGNGAGSAVAGGLTTGVTGGVPGFGGRFGIGDSRAGATGGVGRSGSSAMAGRSGDEGFERGGSRTAGRGTTGSADGTPGRATGTGAGTGALGDSAGGRELAPSRYSAAASELAAGEGRGVLPMGAGAGKRGQDEIELDQRPDYLVESDDIWGDGRLAAPAVLGE